MDENTSMAYAEPAYGDSGVVPAVTASGMGSPLFVINLCASQAPAQLAGKTLPGLEAYRLYQVSRVEDGRTRYRLRLGFFTSEKAANEVLATVRTNYATAFTTCLADEDRRFTRGYLPEAAPAPRPRPVAVTTAAPVQPAKAAVPPAAKAPATAAPVKQSAPTVQTKPAAASTPVATKPATPAAKAPAATAPLAKTTDTQSMKKIAQALEESAVVEMTWEPETKSNTGRVPALTQTAAHPSLEESIVEEIELSWDPPAQTRASAPPALKTDAASKAKPEQKAPAQAPKTSAPAASAPAKTASAPAAEQVKNPPVILKASAPVDLQLESEPAAVVKPTTTANTQRTQIGKGAESRNTGPSLPQKAAPAAAQPAAPISKPAAKAPPVAENPSQTKIAASAVRAPEPAKPVAPAKAPEPVSQAQPAAAALPPRIAGLPDLDSTQTIRALTNDELNDSAVDKWFAIQLAVSDQPLNLDAMPHLDIFEAYRLYSIASAGSGKIVHSLRLGFFREAVSAEAVAGYLKTFFPTPNVMRISAAEQVRFKDSVKPQAAPPPAEVRNDKVVDLNHARDRAARPAIPTVTMEVTPQRGADRSPTGAFKTGAFTALPPVQPAKSGATGVHKALNPTLKPAAKAAAKSTGTATKRSAPVKPSASNSGRYRAPPKMSLQDQLLEEAREVELSESGIRRLPKNHSLLSRLVDKLKK